MEEAINSIINGQRRQALEQLKENAIYFEDLIQELIDLKMIDEIKKMFHVAVNNNYLTVN